MTFTSFKNARIVRSGWLEEGGRRLDCNPYMSGALEARDILIKLGVRKDSLAQVTKGIFDSGRESRQWVDEPTLGIPYMGTSAIGYSDLSMLPLIAKRQVLNNPKLQLELGTSLVTRSGTVGKMAFVRPEMVGMACSEDVLRIVADEEKILPGYLYSFLSSKFGVPLLVAGTYGAIIQHIEPEHVKDLPVPRLGDVELEADRLMTDSSRLMTKYSELVQRSRNAVLSAIGLNDPTSFEWNENRSHLGWGEARITSESFRAFNYDPRAMFYWGRLSEIEHTALSDLCIPEHFKGHIVFKRIESDPEHGYRLLGQRDAFQIRPEGRWISRKSVDGLGLVVPPQTVLIPSHGTLGEFELYCRAIYVTQGTSKNAFSGDFYRCIPRDGQVRGGYLYAVLSTKVAFRILRSMSTGGKQQYQHPSMLARFPIPRLGPLENTVADWIDQAAESYDKAVSLEEEARRIVERAIEGHI
ncbi:methylation-associated defense system restriction endonuclease subunit S MAD5 [Dickeya oryzae]|uniref:methylation-associated defense system restriction endonuclease subunit S MAD5 n=1 Tax=Dickeya oryzae TaxID=1240404 RepID=UPI001AEC885E|nr:restriction endonuclease subunit S [Dickeya oryzae]MBP2847939.1 restriction endonuclease subunit S [Dickeya oryzae]